MLPYMKVLRWGQPRSLLATLYVYAGGTLRMSMCLGLAGIGALVFTKPCSSTHWSCCSLGFKPPENDFFPPAATLAPKAAAGSLWLGFVAFLLLRWKFRLCIASALIAQVGGSGHLRFVHDSAVAVFGGGILAHALHSMSSPQCSHSCLVSTNAGSSEICLKHVSERISPKSAMDCIGYGDTLITPGADTELRYQSCS